MEVLEVELRLFPERDVLRLIFARDDEVRDKKLLVAKLLLLLLLLLLDEVVVTLLAIKGAAGTLDSVGLSVTAGAAAPPVMAVRLVVGLK